MFNVNARFKAKEIMSFKYDGGLKKIFKLRQKAKTHIDIVIA